jgi:hypothetical protein
VTVGDRQEDPVPYVEDLPVCSAKCLEQNEAMQEAVRAPRPVCAPLGGHAGLTTIAPCRNYAIPRCLSKGPFSWCLSQEVHLQ